MEVYVIKTFIDKDTSIRMESDTVVSYGEERAKELIKKGFVKEVEDLTEKPAEEKPAKKSKKKSK